MCDRAGIVSESRRRRYRETPAQMRKRKRTAMHMRIKSRLGPKRGQGIDLGALLRRANIKIEKSEGEGR